MALDNNKNNDDILVDDDELVDEEFSGEEQAKKNLKNLREKLAVCQKEKLDYLEMSQRLKADYVNLKKSETEARSEIAKFAKADLLLELISLADNFEMAFQNKAVWETVALNWRQGVEYIYSRLESILTQNGLETIKPLGQMFDPNLHHSVESITVTEKEKDNQILEVVEKGYTLNGKVIRPAKVKVGAVQL
ncbi:MAG: nucleotide exchange factor GrpE [Patescibacteria group bacterium]